MIDVLVTHAINYPAVVGGNANPCFHGFADPDVPDVDVTKIACRLGPKLQTVAAGFEIAIPRVNVLGEDFASERVITFDSECVVAAASEVAAVNRHVSATHQVHRIARFFDDDIGEVEDCDFLLIDELTEDDAKALLFGRKQYCNLTGGADFLGTKTR